MECSVRGPQLLEAGSPSDTGLNIRRQRQSSLTMTAKLEVDHICDTDVDHTQKPLIPFLELALVEDLHRNDGVLLHGTIDSSAQYHGGTI